MNKEIPQKIKKETRGLKKQSLKLKENLNELLKLKIGLAYIYSTLINELRNNNLTFSKAKDITDKFKETYNLSPNLIERILELVNGILAKKAAVKKIRDNYPDDREFFKILLGKEPRGKIEIIIRPLAIYIKCLDSKDFYDFISYDVDNLNTNINKIIAVNLPTCLIPELAGLIVLENSSLVKVSKYNSEDILKHEEQHIIDKLIFEKQETKINYKNLDSDLQKLKNINNQEEKIALIEKIIRKLSRNFINKYIGSELKSEIFAHLQMGKSIDSTFNKLAPNIKPDKGYYFLDYHKNQFINKLEKIFNNTSEITEIAKKIFQEEYQNIMNRARESLELLNQELEFSNNNLDVIIGLLNYEDLIKWPAITRIIINFFNS